MDRRDFIKLTAVTGTTTALASCGSPENQIIRFVPEDDIVPGVAEWKPSICPLCSAGCGMTVRVMDADVETVRNGQSGVVAMAVAKKLEGDPKHAISRGGLCARGQAAIQITYHPDRLRQPMKRTGARGAGEFAPVSWDEAIADLAGKLDGLGDRKRLAIVTGWRRSRRIELFTEFAGKFGAPPPLMFEPLGDAVLRRANGLSFGREQLPTIDLARTKMAVSFGADFLGTWNSPVAQSAAYAEMRHAGAQARGRFVQIESRMSQTGANADEWVGVKFGTEAIAALGLAHLLVKANPAPARDAGRAGALIEGWTDGLAAYAPDRVEAATGIPAKRLERIARDLVERTPAVAIVGGAALAQTNGLFTALAVNALNALLGAVEKPGGVFFTPGAEQAAAVRGAGVFLPRSVADLAAAQALLLDEANLIHGLPSASGVRAALEKIPFIASFGSFVDDTSAFADLLLPDHSFLETWVDSTPESGALEAVSTVAGPVMKPIHTTRATAEVLIEVAAKLKTPVALPWKTAEELAKGTGSAPPGAPGSTGSRRAVPYSEPRFDGDPSAYPFHFLPYASVAFGDGSAAHLPWLQELPDPLTSAMWSSWVELNPQTAARLGIGDGDIVEVASAQGAVRAPAVIFPGIAPDVVAMPVGQGHEQFTRYASKRGANPMTMLAASTEPETGALAWAATRVKIARVGDADGSLIMFAGEMREHPHEHER